MNENLQTKYHTCQYRLSKDFEIYYYNDRNFSKADLHTHDYFEFYFFIEGDISTQIGNKVYPVKPFDIMLIPPRIAHRLIIHNIEKPYRRFVFWISQDYYNHLLGISADYSYLIDYVQSTCSYIFHNDHTTFNGIQARARRLIEELRTEHFGKETQISLCVNELIMHLNRIHYDNTHPQKRKAEDNSLYRKLILYIEGHLENDLSLEALAKVFYVSKYHIAHVFKENLGMSIHQYVTKKRLTLCREAMLGDIGISEAYQMFGFGDYSSFFRAFKKEYGISPRDFLDMQVTELD